MASLPLFVLIMMRTVLTRIRQMWYGNPPACRQTGQCSACAAAVGDGELPFLQKPAAIRSPGAPRSRVHGHIKIIEMTRRTSHFCCEPIHDVSSGIHSGESRQAAHAVYELVRLV